MAAGRSVAVLILLVSLMTARVGRAQTPEAASPEGPAVLCELVLKDGSRIFGVVERETPDEVVLRTQAGAIVTARRAEIASLRLIEGRVERGEFVRGDLHRTRLFFAPTGRSLAPGEVSFGVFQFVAPFVQVGVTERFSIGGGTPLLFGFEDFERPFWVTPKLQVVRTPRAQAAVGLLHVFNFDGDGGGIAYGVGTIGDTENAFTAGAGLMYSDGDRNGLLMVGGERRVRSNLKLITENYLWRDGHGLLSGGVRFLGERLSADLALVAPLRAERFVAFPVVNFVYVF